MTLTDLIETLSALDPATPVQMGGASGLGVISWRGSYDQPSLDHGRTRLASSRKANTEYGFTFQEPTAYLDVPPAETVGALALALKLVLGGAGLCGYKGGVYTAVSYSTVWADSYGECPGQAVVGVTVIDGIAHLQIAPELAGGTDDA